MSPAEDRPRTRALEGDGIFRQISGSLSVGLETRTRAIAAHPLSGCSRLASGVTAECTGGGNSPSTTDALGGAAPNLVFKAGVGRAVQSLRGPRCQSLKALVSSLWRVSNPRLQRPSRCGALESPVIRAPHHEKRESPIQRASGARRRAALAPHLGHVGARADAPRAGRGGGFEPPTLPSLSRRSMVGLLAAAFAPAAGQPWRFPGCWPPPWPPRCQPPCPRRRCLAAQETPELLALGAELEVNLEAYRAAAARGEGGRQCKS